MGVFRICGQTILRENLSQSPVDSPVWEQYLYRVLIYQNYHWGCYLSYLLTVALVNMFMQIKQRNVLNFGFGKCNEFHQKDLSITQESLIMFKSIPEPWNRWKILGNRGIWIWSANKRNLPFLILFFIWYYFCCFSCSINWWISPFCRKDG